MNGQALATYAAISALAGVLIPIMAALSGMLGRTLGNPWTAAVIVVTGGFLITLIVGLAMGGANTSWDVLKTARPLQLAAGLGFAFYIVAATWLTPRFGVGNVVMFVIVGQIFTSAIIDQFGLFGAPQKPIDLMRMLGISVMAIGVVIAQISASNTRAIG